MHGSRLRSSCCTEEQDTLYSNFHQSHFDCITYIMIKMVSFHFPTQVDTFEPSIPAPSCNIPTFLHFDPLAAGIALDLFDSVDTSSHFLERYKSSTSNITSWINRTIPEPELQCHLCELTCGVSCSDDCESL